MTRYILLKSAFHATAALALLSYLPDRLLNIVSLHSLVTVQIMGTNSHVAFIWLIIFLPLLIWSLYSRSQKSREAKASVYGLQHGRLHLQLPTAMWMNMGYWKISNTNGIETPKTMAEACRDLLNAVLTEAGLTQDSQIDLIDKQTRPRWILDIGFGCGDQTIYMMSSNPVRLCDEQWWGKRNKSVQFDQYVGITKDTTQYRFATERVKELVSGSTQGNSEQSNVPNLDSRITLFCADAATPDSWAQELQDKIKYARETSTDRWVLALDTAYHFSPSRWPLVTYACADLDASFMAFDLCLSPTATLVQRSLLRVLTALMGAPWVNFVTPHEYRQKLVEAGYSDAAVQVKDISEHVFTPLSTYMGEQDQRLKAFGLGIGGLKVAKWMFEWWGRTGVIRGVIVVAKKHE